MKKLCVLLLVLLLAVSLAACAAEDLAVYTVTKDGVSYTVDREKNTISDGNFTYGFTFEGSADAYRATVTYPNGSSYWWKRDGFSGSGGWSNDYREDAYVSGEVLVEVLEEKAPKAKKPAGNAFAAILFLAFGVFFIIKPRTVTYIQTFLWVKDAEPSEFAIFMCRIAGVLLVIVGIAIIV